MTARDLITKALKTLGVLAAGETATSEDAADVLDLLNDMVDSWQLERLFIFEIVRTVKTLSANTQSYTIGTGGDINIVRPTWIDTANLIIDSAAATPTETPLEIFTDQQYQEIPQKTLTSGLAQGIWYDHAWSAGLGRIFPWPVPNVGTTQLVLYTPGTAVASFATLNTDYTFPPGYKRALHYNLAVEIAPQFNRPVSGEVASLAAESKGNVKRVNNRPRELRVDPALTARGGYFDYRTGRVR